MIQLSKKMLIFATSFVHQGQLSEELQLFDPSENLVNSSMRAIRLTAVPPVESLLCCIRMMTVQLCVYRCEPIFHSYAYRYTRTFRLRVSEGSHFLCMSKFWELKQNGIPYGKIRFNLSLTKVKHQ